VEKGIGWSYPAFARLCFWEQHLVSVSRLWKGTAGLLFYC
jgi:hypothetical protein